MKTLSVRVVGAFKSDDEILWHDRSSENSLVVLLHVVPFVFKLWDFYWIFIFGTLES